MADQAGDTFEAHSDNESKFSYPSLMETQIRRLKNSLDQWKELVLQTRNVLLWEKNWHPTALIGGSTILFTFLWLLDPSILTVFAIFGLLGTIFDYMAGSIVKSFWKNAIWTSKKEEDFESVCTNLVLYKARMELAWGRFYRMKTTNKKMYFVVTIIGLSVLAWIGCTFNNLFLTYILVTFLLLLPGLEHNGNIRKCNQFISDFLKTKHQDKKD